MACGTETAQIQIESVLFHVQSQLPGQEPVILLGPPRDYAPEPGQKPAIRQPRFDRSILGEETDGEEAQVPDDRE